MQSIFKKTQREKEDLIEKMLLENYNSYYRLAYSYVHKEADAFDIVQNGAYRAIRNSSSLKQPEYAATWLYRIMLNEIFRFCHSSLKDTVPLESVEEQGKEDTYENIDLQRAINKLSDKDKAVILLRFFEDRQLEEIAQILSENLSTVKSRLYRSLKKLKLDLEDTQL